jgi:glycosyltransferase involved in cell wall biosynthesis
MPRAGIIGRADNTGLGVETWEFCRHIPAKALIVSLEHIAEHKDLYRLNLDRFDNFKVVKGIPTDDDLREFYKDIDVLFTIETPYNRRAYDIAREMGVKSILRINYEWFDNKDNPDLFLAPSLYHFNDLPDPKKYLPFPINREVLPFKLKKKAKKFIHIAGNMKAGHDRNGTKLFLEAIKHIKSDIEIIIKSQAPIECDDKRVRIDIANPNEYWKIWEEADVYVSPRRYAGQSLPLNEAMSRGMAVIMTDMAPQNGFLPKDLLITPKEIKKLMIKQEIEIADIAPEDIAKAIDNIANKDISRYSRQSDEVAKHWSWERLKTEYLKLFKNICS